jgi:squalene synthase HpnC
MPQPYSIDHYENFPVASILLPRRLRYPISIIYAFARQADDIADEGSAADAERLQQLQSYRDQLDLIEQGVEPSGALFRDLAGIIRQYELPPKLFRDLLEAFSQDVEKKRYADFGELMGYCRRSANPIGRLLLHLYGEADARNLAYSDAICSSLQIINFLQDVAIDYQKGRIYLPQDEMEKYHVTEAAIAQGNAEGPWRPFMLFQIERARRLLQSGAPLGKILKGRIGLEMRMIIMGGETILRKLHKSGGDAFHQRPALKPADWAYMFYRALRAK